MMDSLKLTLFGSPHVELDGIPVRFKTRKALALFVYLAVNQQSYSREILTTLLWPEFSSDRAFANLREALRSLKQHLSDRWLDVQRQEVRVKMSSTLWVDVLEFQQHLEQMPGHAHSSSTACAECLPSLLAAIDLYRDDFLRGFTLPDSPLFDEWQSLQTDLLREKMIESLKKVIRYYASYNDFPQAIDYARHWVAQSPWSEAAHRELMRLYALNHQRSTALQQYQECVQMLREEFEAEPEEKTQELYETILTKDQCRVGSMARNMPDGELLREPTLHNLPAQTTTFIGRETEIAAVKNLLSQSNVRLLTLTGAGGSGKTRLGLQVAAELLEDFRDGVFFVSLAPVSNPDLMPSTVVRTIGLYVAGNTPPLNVLKAYLQSKQMLLLLDNFEQIVEAATMLVDLLSTAPDVKIVVTSRTVLRVSGEYEYLVPPLNVPDLSNLPDFRCLTQIEAVQLFAERAKAVNIDFDLTEENTPAVAEICGRLDGLPLAIELAAARIKILSPQALLARLSSPLQFLTGGASDLPARQQTLRDTIVWSHNLLHQEEQILFRRLAVFVGGWTLESAEAICAIDHDLDVLIGLEALLDHNLLSHDTVKGGSRSMMLETIREYALERLTESGEAETIRKRHAQFFVAFAEEANTHLNRQPIEEHVLWKERLTLDMDNLRAALSWAIANTEEWRQSAIHMNETLADILELTGQHEEARKIYQETLCEVPEHDSIWLARLHHKIGKAWTVQSQFEKALDAYDRAQSLLGSEPTGTVVEWWQEWVEIQNGRIYAYYHHGQTDELNALATQVRPIVEQYGTAVQRTKFFYSLLWSAYRRERYRLSEDNVALAQAALSASQETEDLNLITDSQFALGFNYLWADQLENAEEPMQAALTLSRRIGNILLQTQSLTYLTILYRRLGRIDKVKDYVCRSMEAAKSGQLSTYISIAHANLAWLAWHAGDLSATETQATKALERYLPTQAFKWLSLWPLIGVMLVQNRTSEAIEYVRSLLDPKQQRLPDALTTTLENAIQTWDAGDEESTRSQLSQAMELARELQHF